MGFDSTFPGYDLSARGHRSIDKFSLPLDFKLVLAKGLCIRLKSPRRLRWLNYFNTSQYPVIPSSTTPFSNW
ncbi:unnamed protein product [Coffea canephora]|uniref:Uncharacterized protein n=1 Tax=Coffea canephora TaxID=49390 RepID=A0A068V9B5_COFCA|nr:unnamed protein product [Coffea canephora]